MYTPLVHQNHWKELPKLRDPLRETVCVPAPALLIAGSAWSKFSVRWSENSPDENEIYSRQKNVVGVEEIGTPRCQIKSSTIEDYNYGSIQTYCLETS